MSQTGKYKFLRLTCLAMWCGLLIAGLWPFNFFPRNKVEWLRDRDGIHFDWHGQVYSTASFNLSAADIGTPRNDSFSIEMWVQADEVPDWVSHILSVYDPAKAENFRIEQSRSDLVVRGLFRDRNNRVQFGELWLDDIFRAGKARFVSVTSGPQGTAFYLEGAPAKLDPRTLTADNFSGRLLLGHSVAGDNAWAGALLGLAIYHRALTANEVDQHYKTWIQARTGELAAEKGIAALYPFDERTGGLIRNSAGAMPDLAIPPKFYILHREFLAHSFQLEGLDLGDVAINILGFIPFGFLVSAYLDLAAGCSRSLAAIYAVILGSLTSLLIECLQAYLPSRDSSLVDLINNILGTMLGAFLFQAGLLVGKVAKWDERLP